MIKCSFFNNKVVLIAGMGRTGIGAAKSLLESGAKVFAYDDDNIILQASQSTCPNICITEFDLIEWEKIDYLLLSPGIALYPPLPHKIVELANCHNIEIISDIDILYLACPESTYIGITGTNGKSTTTALITHILRENGQNVQVGGNIGKSVLELQSQSEGFYIIELSSYQLDLLKYLKLDTAVITNITPDHIDRHGTIKNYVSAKLKIIDIVQPKGNCVISKDYLYTQNLIIPISNLSVSQKDIDSDIYIKDRILYDNQKNVSYNFSKNVNLPGSHNEENIASAYAATSLQGLDPNSISKSINTFKGLEHRLQTVLQSTRFTFINDSKATNADAAEKALLCFKDIYWIAGGVAKEGGITSILPLIRENVKLTLLIGNAQLVFAQTLNELKLPYVLAGTLDKALDYLKNLIQAQGTVLLSPACASFDQFKSFEHRGDEFKRLATEKFSNE